MITMNQRRVRVLSTYVTCRGAILRGARALIVRPGNGPKTIRRGTAGLVIPEQVLTLTPCWPNFYNFSKSTGQTSLALS